MRVSGILSTKGATVATIMFLILLIITVYQVRAMDRGEEK